MAVILPGLLPGLRPLSVYLEGEVTLRAALESQGLSRSGAREAALHFQIVARALLGVGLTHASSVTGSFVPGRVELLGKHGDYAGGRSLLMAVEQGFSVVTGALGPGHPGIHIVAAQDGERILWSGSHEGESLADRTPASQDRARWLIYPKTLLARLEHDFPTLMDAASHQGVVVAFASSLPQAAGMSSSSAFLTALFLGIVSGLSEGEGREVLEGFVNREQLAEYLSAVEAGRPSPRVGAPVGDEAPGGEAATPGHGTAATPGVGTEGGSQDHVAILCAHPDEAVQYRFLPPTEEARVVWPGDWRLMVASSGVRAEKVAGARAGYNRLAREARQAGRLTTRSGRLGELLPLGPKGWRAASERARTRATEEGNALAARIRQFTTESGELVPAALQAVREADARKLGRVVGRSQLLAQEVLRNQVPETDFLVQEALALGASAASAFGAGFGGSVWAVASSGEAWARLTAQWWESYRSRFPHCALEARFMEVYPGPAAFYLFGSPGAGAPSGS